MIAVQVHNISILLDCSRFSLVSHLFSHSFRFYFGSFRFVYSGFVEFYALSYECVAKCLLKFKFTATYLFGW